MAECNIDKKTCACGVFTVKRFPCIHAIALLHRLNEKCEKKISDLCDPYYLSTTGMIKVILCVTALIMLLL